MEDSTVKQLPSGISRICGLTDCLLWEEYARSASQSNDPDRCRLLFPRYRKKKDGKEKEDLRVSEQEARFVFVEALCTDGQFRYSVETPTDKRYQFKGKKKAISAQTDLTVYDLERCRLCNVEFKAGGISARAKSKDPIFKDVQKLMREPVWGLWFHLLESTESKTITELLKVIREGICKVRSEFECKCLASPGLTIHVCVLKQGFSLQKSVSLCEAERNLHLDCLHVSREELLKVKNLNGWKLYRRGSLEHQHQPRE